MIVLALDWSGQSQAAALVRDGEPLVERLWPAPRLASHGPAGGPLAAVSAVCAAAGVALDAIGLIGVATGPGSFNGIRSGIAAAQGLALALGVPAIGVPTLEALAYQHAGRAATVVAVRPAGRGEYYAATYAGDWSRWAQVGDYRVGSAAEVLEGLAEGTLVCGSVADDVAAVARERGLVLAPAVFSAPRAAYIAALAEQRLADPTSDHAASLQPQYLRRPGITRSTRRHGLARS
jgi:tRNA threonylcarbamoyl adenosine modification protein YeaZ